MKNYIDILYKEWISNLEEPFEIKDANEKFENYIENLKGRVLQDEEITVISNYNGDCSTLYSEFSFQAGFQVACDLIQLIFGNSNIGLN